ncbi:hypothetical protein Tco_1107133 [Tanacetum coccineum]
MSSPNHPTSYGNLMIVVSSESHNDEFGPLVFILFHSLFGLINSNIIPNTSDIEDAFSSNFPDYTPTSLDYFPVLPGNISPDPSDNLSKYLLASLAISPFHDDPYMQAYNAAANEPPIPPQAPIDPPLVLSPSPVLPLSPMFDSRDFFPPKEIPPPKDTKTLVESPILISPSLLVGSSSPVRSTTPPPYYPFDESIFVEIDNSLWIIPQPLGSKPVLEESNGQMLV